MESTSYNSIANLVADFTIVKRKILFVLASLLTILLASGILRITFDTSLNALLTRSDPYLNELEILENEFPMPVEVRFAFVADEGKHVFTLPILRAINDLGERYTELPFANRIISIIDYVYPETQRKLFTRPIGEYTQVALDSLLEEAVTNRLLTANLLSPNGDLSFAIINLDAREASSSQRLQIADAVIAFRDEMRGLHPAVSIQANADVLLEKSSQQAMIDDLTALMPITILICVLTICYCFRSVSGL